MEIDGTKFASKWLWFKFLEKCQRVVLLLGKGLMLWWLMSDHIKFLSPCIKFLIWERKLTCISLKWNLLIYNRRKEIISNYIRKLTSNRLNKITNPTTVTEENIFWYYVWIIWSQEFSFCWSLSTFSNWLAWQSIEGPKFNRNSATRICESQISSRNVSGTF